MRLSGHGSCDYVGIFMDFNIYKITETYDGTTSITYSANEIAGNSRYISGHLDEIILKVLNHEYKNNSFYTVFLNIFIDELKKRG